MATIQRFIVRPAASTDVSELRNIQGWSDKIQKRLYGEVNFNHLVENAVLALSALDQDGKIVGFCALLHGPTTTFDKESEYAQKALKWAKAEALSKKHDPGSTLWLRVCISDSGCAQKVANSLLQRAFAAQPGIKSILAVGPQGFGEEMSIHAHFSEIAASEKHGLSVFECKRQKVLPTLRVRRACVEDHDDLVPVLTRAEQRGAALASLPGSVDPGQQFALARLIRAQDTTNVVLVAENDQDELVGLMALTSAINVRALQRSFELEVYDNLQDPPEEEEAVPENFDEDDKVPEEEAKVGDGGEEAQQEEGAEGEEAEDRPKRESAGTHTSTPDSIEGRAEDAPGEEAILGDDMDVEFREAIEEEEEVEVTEQEEEAEEETDEADDDSLPALASVAFAVSMFCLDMAYEAQSEDFLAPAFEAFPEKDYCLLTIPHEAPEPVLLRTYTRVLSKPTSMFPEVLYLTHRAGSLPGFGVRQARDSDLDSVRALMSTFENRKVMYERFTEQLAQDIAMVALCQGQVVGLAVVNVDVDLQELSTNFALKQCVDMAHHAEDHLAELEICILNPIFNHHRRYFLTEIMRIIGTTCLTLRVGPEQMATEVVLPDFFQVPGRRLVSADPAPYALFVLTRKLAARHKPNVNARLVVCGASETGLACLEHLLQCPYARFSAITLLAPSGVHVGGIAGLYDTSSVAKLGLDAQVQILDARMVGLDRGAHEVHLNDGSTLNYECLLLCTGLQDQTRARLGIQPLDQVPVYTYQDIRTELTEEEGAQLQGVVVYGNTLDAVSCITTLLARGVPAAAILHVKPPKQENKITKLIMQAMIDVYAKAGMDVQLPACEEGLTLTRVDFDEQGAAVVFDKGGQPVVMGCDLLVTCDTPDVDPAVFYALNDSSVVYDGRLVVDADFCTNDRDIYSAGTLAKFSRQYTNSFEMEKFNSREVGAMLAESILRRFVGSAAENSTHDRFTAPEPKMPKGVGSFLPGKMYGMYIALPHVFTLDDEHEGRQTKREPLCRSTEGHFEMHLDDYGTIVSILYVGTRRVDMARLSCIMGLNANYLDQLPAKVEGNQVRDILDFVGSPWASALFHDKFPDLRDTILADVMRREKDPKSDASGLALANLVQCAVLKFVQDNASELVAYAVPEE